MKSGVGQVNGASSPNEDVVFHHETHPNTYPDVWRTFPGVKASFPESCGVLKSRQCDKKSLNIPVTLVSDVEHGYGAGELARTRTLAGLQMIFSSREEKKNGSN